MFAGPVQASVKDSVHCVYVWRTRLCVRARIRINYETMRIYNRMSTRYAVSFLIISSLSLSLSLARARARALGLSLSIWTGNIQLLQRWVQGVYAWECRKREQLDDERSATQV